MSHLARWRPRLPGEAAPKGLLGALVLEWAGRIGWAGVPNLSGYCHSCHSGLSHPLGMSAGHPLCQAPHQLPLGPHHGPEAPRTIRKLRLRDGS